MLNLKIETADGKQTETRGHFSRFYGWILTGFVEGHGNFAGNKLPNGWKVLEWSH